MTDTLQLVSVIVPAHNARAYLADCLASVFAQTGGFKVETIVVDDGSSDDTAAIACRHQDVRCLAQRNRGPAAARNAGIAVAKGQYIAFLDADDLWPPGKLAAELQTLQRHARAALVFGDCRQFDAHGPRPQTEFEANGLGKATWGSGGLVPEAYSRLLVTNFITTGAVVLRRDVLAEVGGFAEDLRLVEDLELWLRIARSHPIAWCAELCLLRRRHAANTSRDAEAMGLAYLDVLRRQGTSEHGELIKCLAAGEYRRLARAALEGGQISVALRRAWASLSPLALPRATHDRQ